MLHDTPVYRSRPAELARAASAFFALLLVGIAAFGVEQAIAHGSYVAFTVVYCILTLAFLVLLRRVSDCRLVATPSGLDIVNVLPDIRSPGMTSLG